MGELLAPMVSDPEVAIEVAGAAALALGLVFVGSTHSDSVEALLQVASPP